MMQKDLYFAGMNSAKRVVLENSGTRENSIC